jgi:hypothetical protein
VAIESANLGGANKKVCINKKIFGYMGYKLLCPKVIKTTIFDQKSEFA